MNRRQRRMLESPPFGMAVHKLVWDGEAAPWCSWCGEECPDEVGMVPIDLGGREGKEPGFYACKFPRRDEPGMLFIPWPELDIPGGEPHPAVFLVCSARCAGNLRRHTM